MESNTRNSIQYSWKGNIVSSFSSGMRKHDPWSNSDQVITIRILKENPITAVGAISDALPDPRIGSSKERDGEWPGGSLPKWPTIYTLPGPSMAMSTCTFPPVFSGLDGFLGYALEPIFVARSRHLRVYRLVGLPKSGCATCDYVLARNLIGWSDQPPLHRF